MGSSASKPGKRPVLIIIGGGYAGIKLAQTVELSGKYEVLVIDRKNYFSHNVGFLRTAVQPDFSVKTTVPYDRALKYGLIIQAYVTDIQPQQQTITLAGWPTPLRYDQLVIATGSSYAFPGKIHEPKIVDVRPRFEEIYRNFKSANSFAIIGGGAVGTELAGELATEYPGKEVRLIHRSAHLVQDNLPESAQKNIQRELTKLGVILHLNQRVEIDAELIEATGMTNYAVGPRTLVTSAGARINTDLVILAVGPQINSSVYKRAFSDHLREDRLIVNDYFQVGNYQNIYAIGDCADIENKQALFSGQQAEHLSKNLIALANGQKSLKSYKRTDTAFVIVSLGRKSGGGFAMGMTFSAWFVAFVKSKDMFASKYMGELHQTVGASRRPPTELQLTNAELSLGLSRDQVQQLVLGLPIPQSNGTHV